MHLPELLFTLLPFSSLATAVMVTKYTTVTANAVVTAPNNVPTHAPAQVSKTPAKQPVQVNQAPAAQPASQASGSDLESQVLRTTNSYRSQHGAAPLTWNDTLADYANSHVSSCIFQHTHGPYGENLASGYSSIQAAIDAWGNESKDYDFANGAFAMSTGHFTQLVWKATTSVGCGKAECNKPGTPGTFLVCEYYPPVSLDLRHTSLLNKCGADLLRYRATFKAHSKRTFFRHEA